MNAKVEQILNTTNMTLQERIITKDFLEPCIDDYITEDTCITPSFIGTNLMYMLCDDASETLYEFTAVLKLTEEDADTALSFMEYFTTLFRAAKKLLGTK